MTSSSRGDLQINFRRTPIPLPLAILDGKNPMGKEPAGYPSGLHSRGNVMRKPL